MLNSQFIEVGIGLVFIFLLMSILVSGINEMLASILSHRGKQLKDAISLALNDPINKDWAAKLYSHPLIDTLRKSEKELPAYISSDNFAKALIELMIQESNTSNAVNTDVKLSVNLVQDYMNGLNTMRSSDAKTLLGSFATTSEGKYDKLKENIENWYGEYMDRVSGWYKKKSKKMLFVLGIVAAVLMNVDTINISQNLWSNSVLREAVVHAAENYSASNDTTQTKKQASKAPVSANAKDSLSVKKTGTADSGVVVQKDKKFSVQIKQIEAAYDSIKMLNLPIGWPLSDKERTNIHSKYSSWFGYNFGVLCCFVHRMSLRMILGWLFTGIAISMGAPVWFDLLNKLINLRSSGNPKKGKKS